MSTTVIHTIEHEIGIDGVLEIRIGDGDIRLLGVDGTTARVRGPRGDDLETLLAFDRGDGSLSIHPIHEGDGDRPADGFGAPGRRGHSPDLTIEAPRDATLVVDSRSGDIEADGFAGEQRYRTASGDLELRAVTGRLTIEAVSGDVDATVVGESTISARTVSGRLDLRAATIATLRAATTSGDIRVAGELDGPGPFTIESVSGDALLALAGDIRVELETVAGDLRSEIQGLSESRPGRRSMIIGRGGPTLSVRTMSGDVRLVRANAVVRGAAPTIVVVDDPVETDLTEAADEAGLAILRALERGEIDVAEAGRRLEALESIGEPAPTEATTDQPTEEPTDA